MLRYSYLLLILVVVGCASPIERAVKHAPEGKHDEAKDRAFCLDYAERYGVINLGPMVGDGAENQPDRQRRNVLFVYCMKEKGYSF